MFRNRPVSLALVGLFLWVTGCASYKQIEPAQVADYDEVRVTFSDGERIVSKDVAVEGDSISYWRTRPAPHRTTRTARVTSPLEQVVEVEAVGTGSGPIFVAVVIVGFLGAMAYTAWSLSD